MNLFKRTNFNPAKPKIPLPRKDDIILPESSSRPIAVWASTKPGTLWVAKINSKGRAVVDKYFKGRAVICFLSKIPRTEQAIKIAYVGKRSVAGYLIPLPKNKNIPK